MRGNIPKNGVPVITAVGLSIINSVFSVLQKKKFQQMAKFYLSKQYALREKLLQGASLAICGYG